MPQPCAGDMHQLEHARGLCARQTSDAQLSASGAALIASTLKTHRDLVRQGMSQREVMRLEQAVRSLDNIVLHDSLAQSAERFKFGDHRTHLKQAGIDNEAFHSTLLFLILGLKSSHSKVSSMYKNNTLNLILQGVVAAPLVDLVMTSKNKLPAASTISRKLVCIDSAICRVQSEVMQSNEGPVWLLTDSSKQNKVEWQLTSYSWVQANNLSNVFEAAMTLCVLRDEFKQLCASMGDSADDVDHELLTAKISVARLRAAAGRVLQTGVKSHILCPMSCTLNTDLLAKSRCIAQQLWLESGCSTRYLDKFS